MKDLQRAPSTGEVQSPEQLEERIQQRAYELYELRGKEDGRSLEDWLQAESELTEKSGG